MTNFNKLQITVILALCFITCLKPNHIAVADDSVVPVDLTQIGIGGGAKSPISVEAAKVEYQGQNYQGVKLTIQHDKTARNEIRIPLAVDAKKYNTLQFKVRLQTEAEHSAVLGEMVLQDSPVGNWASTNFFKFAKKLDGDWYQFSWDIVNQPDNVVGINLGALSLLRLGYGYAAIPEGKTDVVTIIDMKFVSGLRANTGDPELYEQWQKYVQSYKPDYSDSSKYLLPPATGRIAQPLPLTKNGKAFSKIILPQGASQPLTLAGKELQHWLKEISGADIAIISAPDGGNGTRMLLGRKFAAGKFDKDIAALGDSDGFAVRTQGKDIYIFGATDKGTLNGVFTFLENNTDIIWPRPLQEVGVVFTRKPNIDAVWANTLDNPGTPFRGWSIGGRDEDLLWATRNKNNYLNSEGIMVREIADQLHALGNDIQYGGGHNISNFIDRNPEFYPVIDGQKPETFNIWLHQPNFTAPGIVDAVAKNALQFIKDKTPSYVNCITINIEDNWGLSTDPKSLAPIKLPDGSTIGPDDPAFRSTQFFIFLNEVVRKINAVHPKMMVETYAYFFTATVPKVPIDPNIRIMFCPYPRKDYRTPLYSPINDHWWQQMKGWSEASPNVIMREYIGIMNGFRPLAEVQAADLKTYVAHGIHYYTSEMSGDSAYVRGSLHRYDDSWNFLAQEYWIINRLYWNPNQDVEQLRKYYIRRTYREAAPEMEKFFGIIRSEYFKGVLPMSFIDPLPFMDQIVIQPGHETELRGLLAQAQSAAKNATSRVLVDMLRSTFDRWTAQAKGQGPALEPQFFASPTDTLYRGWWWPFPMGTLPAWAAATFIDRDGKTIPAVRMTLFPERDLTDDYMIYQDFPPGLLKAKSGDVWALNINPAIPNVLSKPLQLVVIAIDKNGSQAQAPASAFEATPGGGLKMRWKLETTTGADKPFDVTQIKEIKIIIPRAAIQERKPIEFYLTDMSLGNGEADG